MIQFIKTLPYELPPPTAERFEYLNRLALQMIDPPSIASVSLSVCASVLFHSPLRRVRDVLPNEVEKRGRDYLREIPFDLTQLCTRKEWEMHGSFMVRKRFKQAFIEDRLPVTRRMLFAQIRAALKECISMPSLSCLAVVSHSFRLKLIEAFIKTHGAIMSHSEHIHTYLHDTEITYPFGGGFIVSKEEIKYVIETMPA